MIAYKEGDSNGTQTPSREDPSAVIDAPTIPVESTWTVVDTDDRLSPPTYPDVGPQPGPAWTSACPSTNDVIFYLSSFREEK